MSLCSAVVRLSLCVYACVRYERWKEKWIVGFFLFVFFLLGSECFSGAQTMFKNQFPLCLTRDHHFISFRFDKFLFILWAKYLQVCGVLLYISIDFYFFAITIKTVFSLCSEQANTVQQVHIDNIIISNTFLCMCWLINDGDDENNSS